MSLTPLFFCFINNETHSSLASFIKGHISNNIRFISFRLITHYLHIFHDITCRNATYIIVLWLDQDPSKSCDKR